MKKNLKRVLAGSFLTLALALPLFSFSQSAGNSLSKNMDIINRYVTAHILTLQNGHA